MASNLTLVRAFIASPGGLAEERRAARDAALEIDASIARPFGHTIELYGWEDTISGNGRPQDIINAELDECDLFIGVMWTKWGSPPGGDRGYSSGFEEEFERSLERFTKTGSPRMAMFFKDIPENQLSDPGDELKRVLSFKDRLINEKPLLFNQFNTLSEFSQKVRSFLNAQLVENYLKSDVVESSSLQAGKVVDDSASGAEGASTANQSELVEFLSETSNIIGFQEDDGVSVDPIAVSRLRLIANSYAGPRNDKLTLGVHDAGLIYEDRDNVKLSGSEQSSLLESAIDKLSTESRSPWHWLKKVEKRYPEVLIGFSNFSASDETKIGAIRLISWLDRDLDHGPNFDRTVIGRYWLNTIEDKPRVAALEALEYIGQMADLEAVDEELSRGNKETASAAANAYFAIQSRNDLEAATRKLLGANFSSLKEEYGELMYSGLLALDNNWLVIGIDHRSPLVRALSLRALEKAGDLTAAVLDRALDDPEVQVRVEALMIRDRLVRPASFSEAKAAIYKTKQNPGGLPSLYVGKLGEGAEKAFHQYLRDRIKTMKTDDLEAFSKEGGRDSPICELAKYDKSFARSGSELRVLLEDGFNSLADERRSKQNELEKALAAAFSTVGDTFERQRVALYREAIDILARHGRKSDKDLMIRALKKDVGFLSIDVLRFFGRVGEESDVPLLIELVKENSRGLGLLRSMDPDLVASATQSIKRISNDPLRYVGQMKGKLLATYISSLAKSEFAKIPKGQIYDLLQNESPDVRRQTARGLIGAFSKREIGQILKSCMAPGKMYYYNSIFWLDAGVSLNRSEVRTLLERSN